MTSQSLTSDAIAEALPGPEMVSPGIGFQVPETRDR